MERGRKAPSFLGPSSTPRALRAAAGGAGPWGLSLLGCARTTSHVAEILLAHEWAPRRTRRTLQLSRPLPRRLGPRMAPSRRAAPLAP